jgi:hypothetical protein
VEPGDECCTVVTNKLTSEILMAKEEIIMKLNMILIMPVGIEITPESCWQSDVEVYVPN